MTSSPEDLATPSYMATPAFNCSLVGVEGANQTCNGSVVNDYNRYPGNTNPRLLNGVIVLLLMVLNLMGNGLVFWIYHTMARHNVFNLFVKVLALLDLLTAVTTMLMDTMSKMRPLDDDMLNMEVLCKVTHYQVYATSLTNGCVLTLIAYERYRKICLPLKRSLTIYQAKVILAIATVACLVLSSLALVIKGPQMLKVRMNNGDVAEVVICRYDQHYVGTRLKSALTMLLIGSFCAVLFLMILFYVLVYRSLRRFERRSSSWANGPESSKAPQEEETSSCIDPGRGGRPAQSKDRSSVPDDATVVKTPNNHHVNGANNALEERRQKFRDQTRTSRAQSIFSLGGGPDSVSGQMYKTFLIITVVFVASYLPHLVVLILEGALKLDKKILTYTQRVFLEIGYNCPYISTVANPIVYGFRSAEFRENVKRVLTCPCGRRRRHW